MRVSSIRHYSRIIGSLAISLVIVAPFVASAIQFTPSHCCGLQEIDGTGTMCEDIRSSIESCADPTFMGGLTSINGKNYRITQYVQQPCNTLSWCSQYAPDVAQEAENQLRGYYLPNPFIFKFDQEGIAKLIARIVAGLLAFTGVLTFVMFLWGGVQWLTSAGNAERVEAGAKTMKWAAIGVIVTFASYALLSFLLQALQTPTSKTFTPGKTTNTTR